MKKVFTAALIILFAVPAISQQTFPEPIGETGYMAFGSWTKEEKSAVIFADVCNVRKTADAKGEVAGKLTIGTSVQILEISSVNFTQSGITSPWIKIKSGATTGYIWGGLLTKGSVALSDGSIAVWGLVDKKIVDEVTKVTASVRIAKNGALISKHDFLVKHGSQPEDGSLSLFPAPKLQGVNHILVFVTLSEACGVYASSHYMLVTVNGLHFIGSGWSMGDGGQLHTSKAFVFPYDKEGDDYYDYHYWPTEGHIYCVENDGGYDDNCIWVETTKMKDFLWKEASLEKTCEY